MTGLLLGAMQTNAAEIALPALKLLTAKRPLVIGHRGFCHLAPENTLPSFRLAMESGADMVELDWRQTSDGQLIVIHDPELDRTTDAAKRRGWRHARVETRTAAEIQSLDAGSWFDPKFAGARIPLLAEALHTIQEKSVTLMEHKAGEPAACVSLLRENNLINHVVVQSFDWRYLREFHELEPSQVLGALGPPLCLASGKKPSRIFKKLDARWLKELQHTGAKIAVWNRQVSKAAVRLAHQRGLKVWVYTVNDARLAKRLLAAGVDGIITNKVSLIRKMFA